MKFTYKQLEKTKDLTKYEVTVEYAELAPFKEISYRILSKDVKMPGFRPGKAPREAIEARLGSKLITDSIGRLIPQVAYEVIAKEKARPVAVPEYTLDIIDVKEGIKFFFEFVDYPAIELGDFSKIKVKKEEPEVKPEDVDMVVRNIIRSTLSSEKIKELASSTPAKKKEEEKDTTDKKEDTKTEVEEEKPKSVMNEDFELNDALIAELKYDEKNLEEIRKSVTGKLKEIKDQQKENEYIDNVIREAVKLSKIEIPNLFIKRELDSTERQFMERLKQINLDTDTYLATQNSSIDKKREEWKKEAEERVGVDLLLIAIADKNKEVASDEDIDKEIESVQDPALKNQYENENAREYVRTVITRQRGLKTLLDQVKTNK
jgi:trigger factor